MVAEMTAPDKPAGLCEVCVVCDWREGRMGSKADYEARKAAKRAKQAAEAAAQRPAVCEAHVTPVAEAAPDEDQELRYRNTLDAEQAAYQAAGLAKLTPLIIMAKTEHPLGDMLLSRIFPEHRDGHCIGFCVTVEPGHRRPARS